MRATENRQRSIWDFRSSRFRGACLGLWGFRFRIRVGRHRSPCSWSLHLGITNSLVSMPKPNDLLVRAAPTQHMIEILRATQVTVPKPMTSIGLWLVLEQNFVYMILGFGHMSNHDTKDVTRINSFLVSSTHHPGRRAHHQPCCRRLRFRGLFIVLVVGGTAHT